MKFRWFVSTLVLVGLTTTAFAQFDDLYYDPKSNTHSSDGMVTQSNSNAYSSSYDDESYEYYDDGYYDDTNDYDDYQYSTRIRRFWRPSYNIGYYSPVWGYSWRDPFWDPWYNSWYDPYWYGGNNVVVVIGNSGWGSWNRWNRWNNWSCGYNNWGWNNYGWNSWGWNNYGWNNWGWGNNYVVNNYYGWNRPWNGHHNGNHNNNNNGNNHPYGTYYGSRKNGSSIASTKGRIDGPRKDTKSTEVSPDAPNRSDFNADNTVDRPTSSNRQRRGDFENKPAEEKSSIYTRKRTEVTGPNSGNNGNSWDREPSRRPDPTPQMDRNRDQDRPSRNNNTEQQRSYERPRSSDNSNRSNHNSSPSRSRDSGSYNSGNSGGGSSRSSHSGGGGGGGRSSSSPRRGG